MDKIIETNKTLEIPLKLNKRTIDVEVEFNVTLCDDSFCYSYGSIDGVYQACHPEVDDNRGIDILSVNTIDVSKKPKTAKFLKNNFEEKIMDYINNNYLN